MEHFKIINTLSYLYEEKTTTNIQKAVIRDILSDFSEEPWFIFSLQNEEKELQKFVERLKYSVNRHQFFIQYHQEIINLFPNDIEVKGMNLMYEGRSMVDYCFKAYAKVLKQLQAVININPLGL